MVKLKLSSIQSKCVQILKNERLSGSFTVKLHSRQTFFFYRFFNIFPDFFLYKICTMAHFPFFCVDIFSATKTNWRITRTFFSMVTKLYYLLHSSPVRQFLLCKIPCLIYLFDIFLLLFSFCACEKREVFKITNHEKEKKIIIITRFQFWSQ